MIFKVFLTKQSASLKFLTWCVIRSFESVDKYNVEEWLQSDMCELEEEGQEE
jgi:hypothetical protein